MVCETLNLNSGSRLRSSLFFPLAISIKRDMIVPLPTPLGPHTTNGCSISRCDVVVVYDATTDVVDSDEGDIIFRWMTEDCFIPPQLNAPLAAPPRNDLDTVDRMLHPIPMRWLLFTNDDDASADRRLPTTTRRVATIATVIFAITVVEVATKMRKRIRLARILSLLYLLGDISIYHEVMKI